jgi:hypothetical protein
MKCASRVGSEVRKIKARKLPGKPCSKAYSRVVQAPHQTQPSGHGSPQANALTAGPSRLLKESNYPKFSKFGVLKCFVKPYETSFLNFGWSIPGKTKILLQGNIFFKVQDNAYRRTQRQQLESAQCGASRRLNMKPLFRPKGSKIFTTKRCVQTAQCNVLVQTTRQNKKKKPSTMRCVDQRRRNHL